MIVGWLGCILNYWLSVALLVILMLLAFLLPGEAIGAARRMMRTALPGNVVPRTEEMPQAPRHLKGPPVRWLREHLNIWAVCAKTFHFCAFALLSFLIFRGLDLSSGLSDRGVVLCSLGVPIVFGVLTVTVQTCGDLRAIRPLTEGQPSTEFALQADSSPQT